MIFDAHVGLVRCATVTRMIAGCSGEEYDEHFEPFTSGSLGATMLDREIYLQMWRSETWRCSHLDVYCDGDYVAGTGLHYAGELRRPKWSCSSIRTSGSGT